MNDRERSLVPYYDRTLDYYSPVGTKALDLFKINWADVSSVLDLGCGDGRLLGHVGKMPVGKWGVEYMGIDASTGRIDEARRKWPRCEFMVADLYDPLPTRPAGWSLVCLFEVLEHLAKPALVLSAAIDALKPGGRVIGSVPIADGPSERHLQMYATAANARERLLEPTWSVGFGRHLLMEWRTQR